MPSLFGLKIGVTLVWPLFAFAQPGAPAIVQVTVDTAYDDSLKSLELISHLLDALPPRTEQMKVGESLSGFILRVYGVSRFSRNAVSFFPSTSALLERKILELNHVDRPESLKAGPVTVPQLPKKALADFNPLKPANSIPSIAVFTSASEHLLVAEPTTAAHVLFAGSPAISKLGRLATQSAQLILSLPAVLARNVLSDPVIALKGTALSFPMNARLADWLGQEASASVEVPDHKVLSDADRTAIASVLLSKAQRNVNLFVLDTGWPDADEYSSSRSQLRDVISSVWTNGFGLAPPSIQSDPAFIAPQNQHCLLINRALREFRDLDKNSHVRVIYVPLTREQNADQLLTVLLQTSYLVEFQKAHRLAKLSGVGSDVFSTAKKNAEQVVKQSLLRAWPSDSDTVTTDKGIIDAMLRLGEASADAANSVFFIDASWTVPHEQYFVAFPSPPRGLIVAAVGNFGSDAVLAETDFAQRCTNNTDTLAVMNLRPGPGLLCCSSRIPDQDIDRALAVGFDGEVLGSDCASVCGTSFAAPGWPGSLPPPKCFGTHHSINNTGPST